MPIINCKDKSEAIKLINETSISKFVKEVFKRYPDDKKQEEAVKVVNELMRLLEWKRQIAPNNIPTWVEVVVAAALIHNTFYDGTLTGVFKARQELAGLATECGVPVNGASLIFQAIESQLGLDMPVESCQPDFDSPKGLLALACWYIKRDNPDYKIPEGKVW